MTIFCPDCNQLVLNQDSCPSCGWRRPVQLEGVGEEVWRTTLDARPVKPHCYPVVAGEHYCLSVEESSLIAIDMESGQLAWQRPLSEGCVAHALATDDRCVFVGCEDVRPLPTPGKELLALNARTGQEVWQYPSEAHSLSGVAVSHGTLYFTAANGYLHAVDAVTGEMQWRVRHTVWGPAPPAVDAGLVCAGGRGNTLVAYATGDGKELWRFSARGWFATRPCIADGCVYALCWDDHLYALDAHTGRPLWQVKGERGKGLTTPSVVTAGRVFAGGRVYQEIEGNQAGTYAMLALSAQEGEELWRFHTRGHIFTPPAVADDILFFGSNDGFFYAVDVVNGEQRWRTHVESRVVTEPQVSGDTVYFGGRDGTIYAVRWRVSAVEELLAPDVYVQQGQFGEAAVAHALRGELAAAAAVYEKELDGPQEAAQLYERAEKPGKAALLWERLGELERARDLYREAGDKAGLAQVLLRLGDKLGAAHLFEETGQLEQAAQIYEQAGDQARAAELYSQLGQLNRARRLWESLGSWEEIVQALLAAGKLAEAAQILEEQDRLERAVTLFEEAGQLQRALHIHVTLGNWEKAAELASIIGDYLQAAEAREKLGHPRRAADAYERAAEQLIATEPEDEEGIAALFEQAARLHGGIFDEERASACRRRVRRYRHLPQVVVRGEAQDAFVEREWNTLNLRVENTGYGLAHGINIALRGAFDIEGASSIEGLSPQATKSLELFVRPHKGHYGPKVPLEITVAYKDSEGNEYEVAQRLPVRVTQQGISPGSVTPLEVRILGDLIRPDAKVKSPTDAIRDLLTDAFSDEELTKLCFDHFRDVYMGFSSGMGKGDKIERLLEHCVRQETVEVLLRLVKERKPAQYARFAPILRRARTAVQPSAPAKTEAPSPAPRRESAREPLKLQMSRLVELEFEVRAFETLMGEVHATTGLPYNHDQLIAILKALPVRSLDAARLTSAQTDALRHLGLAGETDLVPDRHMRVGRALYQALFPGDIGTAFQMAWNRVRTQRGAVAVQLRFDEDAVALARYPWELLYYRRHLLPAGAAELTRYISYPEAPTALPVEPPLRVLHIESRPIDLNPLPSDDEGATVRAALASLVQEGLLLWEELSPPTYDALIDRIESAQDHVLHFDGHGTVARRCPTCGTMNYPHHTICQRSGCGRSLGGVPPLGYLAFEHGDESHEADWVDSKALESIVYGSALRVAVLSACRGSEVRGETLFGGAGPALIQAGVPAVVAMQVSVTVSATIRFMQGFYGALARFESLAAAMTSGRRRLFRGQEWFIPTLYLRSQDDEGLLFVR